MNVLIDASRANDVTEKTGVHYHARHMIEALMHVIPPHVRVTMLTGKPLDDRWPALPAHWQHRQLRWSLPLWTTLRLSLHMLRHLKADTYLYMPASQPPLIHPRLIVTIHDIGYARVPWCYPLVQRIWHNVITRYTLARAKLVIAPSAFTKKELIDCYHANEQQVAVVPNAATPCAPKQATRDGGLLYIGRIEHKKNITCIIRAFEILKRSYHYPNLTLTLVGADGYGAKEIHARISRSAFGKDIVSTGYVSQSEKCELLNNARLFLFPSRYEGFGMPIVESIAVGLPVVASDIPPHREVGGEGVVYVDPDNPRAWAEIIHSMLSEEVPKNHSTYPNNRYTWHASAQIWWEKVSKLANKKNDTYNKTTVA